MNKWMYYKYFYVSFKWSEQTFAFERLFVLFFVNKSENWEVVVCFFSPWWTETELWPKNRNINQNGFTKRFTLSYPVFSSNQSYCKIHGLSPSKIFTSVIDQFVFYPSILQCFPHLTKWSPHPICCCCCCCCFWSQAASLLCKTASPILSWWWWMTWELGTWAATATQPWGAN